MKWYQIVFLSFFFGIFGGIFADQILWPYFIERPLFYKYKLENLPAQIIEKREIRIQENVALKEAIERTKNSVFYLETKAKEKTIEGSGYFLTSDCLGVSLSSLVLKGAKFSFFDKEGPLDFQIIKRDENLNLVLIKFEKSKCNTTPIFDLEKLKLGERIFTIGRKKEGLFAEEGIVVFIGKEKILTNFSQDIVLEGSPVFDIEGRLLGILFFEKEKVFVLPAQKIKEFSGL